MLKIENLSVHYGGVHALHGVSLEVKDGMIVTLLGANGAGKSSILRSISGLEKTDEGSHIYLGDEKLDLTTMQAKDIVKAGVAMTPEHRRIFGGLTVEENLKMGAWIRKDHDGIHRDIESIFEMFPILKERYHQKAITLSGGEQQMLSVSRSLMSHPKLLLMDEPSLGLAPLVVSSLFENIRRINRERGMSILLVEQNMRAAIKIADYGYVLETGDIVLEGTKAELENNKKVQDAYLG